MVAAVVDEGLPAAFLSVAAAGLGAWAFLSVAAAAGCAGAAVFDAFLASSAVLAAAVVAVFADVAGVVVLGAGALLDIVA